MIKIKHFLDAIEADDGRRIWVEPIKLTRELHQWCGVDEMWCHLGPEKKLWEWFEEHPDGYEHFRGKYHEALGQGPHGQTLRALATFARRQNVTLLHQGDDPQHNTGVALYEFLSELGAWCEPEAQ